jgi:hypothetical protein
LVQLQHLLLPSLIVTFSQVRDGMPLPLQSCCIPGLGPKGLLHNCTILVNLPGIFLLRVTLASGETLPTRNLPSEALWLKSCLYETPCYVAAPIRETGDVIMHLQGPEFFWFTSDVFLQRPVLIKYWLLCPFFRGSHMQVQHHQWTTLRT